MIVVLIVMASVITIGSMQTAGDQAVQRSEDAAQLASAMFLQDVRSETIARRLDRIASGLQAIYQRDERAQIGAGEFITSLSTGLDAVHEGAGAERISLEAWLGLSIALGRVTG